jgi:hypothetical protein
VCIEDLELVIIVVLFALSLLLAAPVMLPNLFN